MGGHQPFMYDGDNRNSFKFPEPEFDPKAVTRASWEPKPKKPKQEGPMISFNRHPDFHEGPRSSVTSFRPISEVSKTLIRWTRYIQIGLRSLQVIAGIGLLVLMILINNVDPMTAWVMRITPGVIAICSAYAILHHARPARARPPASSAAYQLFAGITDCAAMPLYSFGFLAAQNDGTRWDTLLTDKKYLPYFVASEKWTLLGAACLHFGSLLISVYLGLMFKKIASMPPDMNPLESNLTTRMHKRNKSSVTTSSAATDSLHRLSTNLEEHRRSGAPYEAVSRPPSIPFMHTRQNSRDSFAGSKRDSRSDLPSRQYQIPTATSSRYSVATFNTESTHPPSRGTAHRGNYSEIPLHETGSPHRPGSSVAEPLAQQPTNASPTRLARFTDSWYASDSLNNRTKQRQGARNVAGREQEQQRNQRNSAYEALSQRYDHAMGDSDDENFSDRDYDMMRPDPMDDVSDVEDDNDEYRRGGGSPINAMARMSTHEPMHPLRSHPSSIVPTITVPAGYKTPTKTAPRQKTPFRALRDSVGGALSEVNLNSRRVSGGGGQDIADAKDYSTLSASKRYSQKFASLGGSSRKSPRNRDSSMQAEHHDVFLASKPYGELRPATPPVMIGMDVPGSGGRQVSSGNDYEQSSTARGGTRRHVSGKAAEEGMAGGPRRSAAYSRYSILND